MKERTGSCECGELSYSVSGEPINLVFCYCKSCQIHTGSDKWFGAWFRKGQFRITHGEPKAYTRLEK